MTEAGAVRRVRLRWVDGLRALAALYVVVHHAWATVYPINLGIVPEGISATLTSWMAYGHVGVTVFIVLAGYSLTIAVAPVGGQLRGGFFGFMARRGWRIIPPYWAALGITLLLALSLIPRDTGTHWDQSVPVSWIGVLVDFLLLQDLIPVTDTSYVFWSIAVEWRIYLIFPLMLWVWRRWNLYAGAAVGIVIGLAGIVGARFLDYLNGLWPAYYIAFALGMLASAMAQTPPEWLKRIPIAWLGLLGAASVLAITMTHDFGWMVAHMKPIDLALAASISCLLFGISIGQAQILQRMLAWKALAFAGLFSYSIYLMHAPLLQLGWQYIVHPFGLERGWEHLVMFIVVTPIVVLVTYGFHLCFEKPFLGRAPWERSAALVRGSGT